MGPVLRLARTAALCLSAVLLVVGGIAGVIHREVLDADRFAAHVDAVRSDPDVARQLGALLTTRLLEEQPDLVAVRPLIEAIATDVVSSASLGPVVRRGVKPFYRALVLGQHNPVVLRLADVGAVVVAALKAAAPQTGVALPPELDIRLSDIGAGKVGTNVLAPVHLVRVLSWLAPLLGLLMALLATACAGRERFARRALGDVGRAALGAGGLLAALLVLTGATIGRSDRDTLSGAVRLAVWAELSPVAWVAAAGVAAAGLLLVMVTGRPDPTSHRLLGAGLSVAVGLALVTDPAAVWLALLWVIGAGLLAYGLLTALVALAHVRAARAVVLTALGVLILGVVIGSWPADRSLGNSGATGDAEACNGHAALCARHYDQVAFPATHNAMAAASEPGWFFPEQPDGITAQLRAGIRTLLIDSWYGRRTNRPGVATTVGEARDRAEHEASQSFGKAAVASALRLERAAGLAPRGPTRPYLCHGLCELGSTPWRAELDQLRSWLVANPREVVTLIVQDEVSPADTAELIEQAGLLPYVYTPEPGNNPWPTLGQMIESGERLVVMMENRGGGSAYPWLLQGFDRMQDTPFLFRTPDALTDGADTCAHNRGRADAPLFLVNHWVTDKRAEVTNAERVNAADVLEKRVQTCRQERGLLPNYVAVDFYDRGDLFAVVDRLNGFG